MRFDPESIGVLVPIIIFMIPIIAILTKHQQKMAELIHGNQANNSQNSEMQMMREEMRQLRETVSTLALNMENMKQNQDVQNRINQQS